jgi:hypothetical protein
VPHCQIAIPAEAHLARLIQTGSAICSLYELESTFDQVLIDLGLASTASDERERIRSDLGKVMGRGLGENQRITEAEPRRQAAKSGHHGQFEINRASLASGEATLARAGNRISAS